MKTESSFLENAGAVALLILFCEVLIACAWLLDTLGIN